MSSYFLSGESSQQQQPTTSTPVLTQYWLSTLMVQKRCTNKRVNFELEEIVRGWCCWTNHIWTLHVRVSCSTSNKMNLNSNCLSLELQQQQQQLEQQVGHFCFQLYHQLSGTETLLVEVSCSSYVIGIWIWIWFWIWIWQSLAMIGLFTVGS